MNTITVTTPENIEIEYRLAATGSRITAAFLDYLIQGSVYALIFLFLIESKNPLLYLETKSSYFLAVALLLIALINYGYFVVSEMLMEGGTVGKRVLGIKTIRKNGQPISITHSLIRNLFRVFIDNYVVGILMIFFRGDHGRLGDILSSTMVIEVEQEIGYDTYRSLPQNLENRLTEEEKQLLITYLKDIEKVTIEKEELKEKLIDYFHSKYSSIDQEVVDLVEEQINKGNY